MLQARYGLRDDELLAMPYARFLERVHLASGAINAERRERLERLTLGAWLNHLSAGGRMEWVQYRRLVIPDPEAEDKNMTLEDALGIAERIAAMDASRAPEPERS